MIWKQQLQSFLQLKLLVTYLSLLKANDALN